LVEPGVSNGRPAAMTIVWPRRANPSVQALATAR